MEDYLLSIVIPTRNRQQFLLESLKQILKCISNDVQIVIQDNSDNSTLADAEVIRETPNILYHYTSEILSFVDNFDEATSLATGRYICMIGDDDGICEDIVEVTKWADENRVDSVIPDVNFEYFWPNSISLYGMEPKGILRILKKKASSRWIDSKKGVVDVLKNGCQNYMKYDVVKLYHGIVRRECMQEVNRVAGKYFGGVSPDIYISIALSLVCKKNIAITTPLTIAGVCKTSGSADSSTGKHTGKYKDMPHLKGHQDYHWSDRVPKFYSVETVWAESAIAAVVDMKQDELLRYFNLCALDAMCKLKYGDYTELLDETNQAKIYKMNSPSILMAKLRFFAQKIYWRLQRIGVELVICNNIPDLCAAYSLYMSEHNPYANDKRSVTSVLNQIIGRDS